MTQITKIKNVDHVLKVLTYVRTPPEEPRVLKKQKRVLEALKRLGKPKDVAQMVVFLCSNNADWITGQVLSINGGFCMV